MKALRQARQRIVVQGPFHILPGQHQSELPWEQHYRPQGAQQHGGGREQKAEANAPAPPQASQGDRQQNRQRQFDSCGRK
jgi:hypothetical protein